MDVSVIIVNYNTKQVTSNCIESVIRYTTGLKYEIILVDNASTDGSKEYFEKDKRIKYVYSDENLGFGRANNLGANIAIGAFLFLLNSDTILIENSINIFYNFLKKNNIYVACGCQLIYPNGNYQQSEIYYPYICHDLVEIIPASFRNIFIKNKKDLYKIDNIKEVDVINGANIFIKNKIYSMIGGFDKDYFMYFEETDLFYRIKMAGFKSCILPDTKIIHINGGSFKSTTSIRSILQYESKLLFYKKHFSKLYLLIARIILSISILIRFNFFKSNFKKAFKTIWG